MPKRPRTEAPGAIHHVVAQGNNRCAIVLDDRDRLSLIRRLAAVGAAALWQCHAYCLLDTHLHVLVETPEPNLGRGMQRLLGGYAYAFNRRHGREGHLFASPFYSRAVERDEHVITAAVYVVMNPVVAGLCHHPSEWQWGSYRATAEPRATFVATDLPLALLAPDSDTARARYRALVEQAVERDRRERSKRQGSG